MDVVGNILHVKYAKYYLGDSKNANAKQDSLEVRDRYCQIHHPHAKLMSSELLTPLMRGSCCSVMMWVACCVSIFPLREKSYCKPIHFLLIISILSGSLNIQIWRQWVNTDWFHENKLKHHISAQLSSKGMLNKGCFFFHFGDKNWFIPSVEFYRLL